jgi:hypothetical protein
MSKFVMFELRSGEKRLYQGVDRVDSSRPHRILVYGNNTLIAQLNKQDVLQCTWHDTMPAAAPPALRPTLSQTDEAHH